jgi:hypothetical protein
MHFCCVLDEVGLAMAINSTQGVMPTLRNDLVHFNIDDRCSDRGIARKK